MNVAVINGSAVNTHPVNGGKLPVELSGAASVTFTTTAGAVRRRTGTGSAAVVFMPTADARRRHRAGSSMAVVFSVSAAAARRRRGAGTTAVTFMPTASASRRRSFHGATRGTFGATALLSYRFMHRAPHARRLALHSDLRTLRLATEPRSLRVRRQRALRVAGRMTS